MADIKGVLLDKDGTLVDFETTWSAIAFRLALEAADSDRARAEELMEMAGYDLEARCFRADSVFAAGTNADIVAIWYPNLGRAERREKVLHFDEVTAVEGAAKAVPIEGALDAVARLRGAGLRLGMATNDSTQGAEQTLVTLGIAQMFDAAFGYDAVATPKPAPDVVHAFADMTALKAAQIAMVGDNRHDLETGRAAGAGLVVGVLSGTGTREKLAPLADLILDSIAELPAHLLGERG